MKKVRDYGKWGVQIKADQNFRELVEKEEGCGEECDATHKNLIHGFRLIYFKIGIMSSRGIYELSRLNSSSSSFLAHSGNSSLTFKILFFAAKSESFLNFIRFFCNS